VKTKASGLLYNKKFWLILFLITYAISWLWLPEELPLYYSFALKADRLASKYELLLLPLIVFIISYIAENWLKRLALGNETVEQLIKFTVLSVSGFAYFLFLKIILLVV
jgi:hypothetical protein